MQMYCNQGYTPTEVLHNPKLVERITLVKHEHKQKFKLGDKVQIRGEIGIMTRGYDKRWNATVYKIREVLTQRSVIVYRLQDTRDGEDIQSIFYESELSPV